MEGDPMTPVADLIDGVAEVLARGPEAAEVKPEVALVQRADAVGLEVKELQIVDQKSFDQVGAFLRKVVTIRREIEAHYKPLKQAQDLVKAAILDREKAATMLLVEPERVAKQLIVSYETEMRRKQAELDRIEKARAEEEHEAERQRRIDEARDNATRELVETLDGATPQETKVLDKHADSIINNAGKEAARSMPTTVVHRVDEVIRKAPGISTGVKYSVQVDDAMKIIKAVYDGTLPLAYVTVNESALNAKARLEKLDFDVPGCTLLESGKVSVRTKRRP